MPCLDKSHIILQVTIKWYTPDRLSHNCITKYSNGKTGCIDNIIDYTQYKEKEWDTTTYTINPTNINKK